MSLVWHLVKKDSCRLRAPLAVFSLLVAGKIVFYAYISGLFSAPDIEWLQRMQQFPEILLRFLTEPVFAYLLVGWMVFEDSPTEQDAHWLTRPISGAQQFGAKLAGAGLMFVVWPLTLKLVWWVGCGASTTGIVMSVGEFVGMNSAVVALGLACAALTGDFPRFVLWSIVGVVVFGMAQLAFATFCAPGLGFERMVVCLIGSGLAALVVAGHQFVTRRRWVSLGLVGASLLVIGMTGGAWRWNFTESGGRRAARETPETAQVSVKLTGPARYRRTGSRHFAELPLRIDGVPDKSEVDWVKVTGDWSFGGERAWTSNIGRNEPSFWREGIRRQLGFAAPAEPDGQVTVSVPFSLIMAQRAVREPAALQARLELQVKRGKILAELPLRENHDGAYTISYVSSGPMRESRSGKGKATGLEPPQNAVSLLFTEKSAEGLRANLSPWMVATRFALVNRKKGEFFLEDAVRSGPEVMTVLNQTKIACMRLTYLVGPAPVHLEEMSLVILHYDGKETVKVNLAADPIAFAADSLPESVGAPAGPDTARMAELVRAHAADSRFMGSVLVAKGDAVVFAQSAGWAQVEQKAPNTADTRFRIGSLTKQFTAAAILLLAESGRLQVDDPLAKFVPDVPDAWRAITLRQLLTHTSGIPNFTDLPEFATWKLQPRTPAQMMAHIRDRPLDFTPGERFKYSNSGYVLLGWVVELASGRSYEAFLREHIFQPLGMRDTGCDTNAPPSPQHASGYVHGRDGPERAFLTEMQGPGGAGVLYSTTGDLLRWTQGLFGGKLLSAASLELLTTPEKNGYAFGIAVTTVNGRKSYSHNGAIDGFNSRLDYYPEEKLTVVMLANTTGAPFEITDQLAATALGQAVTLPSERKEVAVPADTLRRYAGVYELAPGVTNTVRFAAGQLTVQLSGQRAFPVFPESERKFFLKVIDAQVEFVTDAQGRVTHLLQFQGGRTQTAPRIGEVVERQAIAVPPDVLAAYVGRYELRPDLTLAVTLEGGELMGAASGQGKSPLLAETETKFFSPVVDAQVEFFREGNGAATYLIVHIGGRDQRAPRKP